MLFQTKSQSKSKSKSKSKSQSKSNCRCRCLLHKYRHTMSSLKLNRLPRDILYHIGDFIGLKNTLHHYVNKPHLQTSEVNDIIDWFTLRLIDIHFDSNAIFNRMFICESSDTHPIITELLDLEYLPISHPMNFLNNRDIVPSIFYNSCDSGNLYNLKQLIENEIPRKHLLLSGYDIHIDMHYAISNCHKHIIDYMKIKGYDYGLYIKTHSEDYSRRYQQYVRYLKITS
jgi:hypothetical protein